MSLEGGPLRLQSRPEHDSFLAYIPRVLVKRLEVAYPLAKIWMAETNEIVHLWQEENRTRRLINDRSKGRETLRDVKVLDTIMLQHVDRRSRFLLANSETGELVGNLTRNFSRDLDALKWLDGRVKFKIRHQRGASLNSKAWELNLT
jgi:hypothetical protein